VPPPPVATRGSLEEQQVSSGAPPLSVIDQKKQYTVLSTSPKAATGSTSLLSAVPSPEDSNDDLEECSQPDTETDPKKRVQTYLDETFRSRKLFIRIVAALAQVWGVLALMYWSLLTQHHQLMDCFGHTHGAFVVHTCAYTKACLRGFPVLAANVTLVMTVRILLQRRIYYSLLQLGYVMDFADTHILESKWPWICAFSMSQGGLHLALKLYFDPERAESHEEYVLMARKFVLPGYIFLVFFLRYVDIEDALIPLNRLVEKDYTKENRHCATLSTMLAMDERVMAFDARHRDIIGDSQDAVGRPPTIQDIFINMIDGYEAAHVLREKHVGHHWGFFRSLWPASVLVDRRLDWRDSHTREWLISFLSLLVACCLFAVVSLLFYIGNIYETFMSENFTTHKSAIILVQAVLVWHGICVGLFLHHTVHGMFFFSFRDEIKPDGYESPRGSRAPTSVFQLRWNQ
jgi:hypothetical protein